MVQIQVCNIWEKLSRWFGNLDIGSEAYKTAGVGGRGTVRQIPRQRSVWFGREGGLSSGDTSVAKRV